MVIFVEIKNAKNRLRGEADLSLYSTYAKCTAKMRAKEEKEFEEKEKTRDGSSSVGCVLLKPTINVFHRNRCSFIRPALPNAEDVVKPV